MKKVFVFAGLMLVTVFASCEKERIEDDIDYGKYKIESVSAAPNPAGKGNDNFIVTINDETVTATYDREQISQDDQGNLVVNRFYSINTSFGADTFAIILWFKGQELDYAELHFYGPGQNAAGQGQLLSIETGGQDNVVVGDYTATYTGKGNITFNSFFTQTGEIDLSWTINVTPPSTSATGKYVDEDSVNLPTKAYFWRGDGDYDDYEKIKGHYTRFGKITEYYSWTGQKTWIILWRSEAKYNGDKKYYSLVKTKFIYSEENGMKVSVQRYWPHVKEFYAQWYQYANDGFKCSSYTTFNWPNGFTPTEPVQIQDNSDFQTKDGTVWGVYPPKMNRRKTNRYCSFCCIYGYNPPQSSYYLSIYSAFFIPNDQPDDIDDIIETQLVGDELFDEVEDQNGPVISNVTFDGDLKYNAFNGNLEITVSVNGENLIDGLEPKATLIRNGIDLGTFDLEFNSEESFYSVKITEPYNQTLGEVSASVNVFGQDYPVIFGELSVIN